MKQRLFCLTLIFAVGLLAAACGGAAQNETPQDGSDQDGEKIQLTISTLYAHPPFQTAIERFEALHPEVEVVVHKYDDYSKYSNNLTTQLLAGQADDLFDGGAMNNLKFHESGYLADIYLLMQNDPDFNEGDYFMNVFEAVAHQGKLMVFPTVFSYDLFGVNNRVPADLAARFGQYKTVTNRQILELYQEFAAESNLYAYRDFDAYLFLNLNIQDYVDFEHKTCEFNNAEFIQLLYDLKEATKPQRIANGMMGEVLYGDVDFYTYNLEEEAAQYLFKWADSGRAHYAALFPFVEQQAFTDFKPVVSEAGKLLINTTSSHHYSISEASPNKEWAWEFLKFLTTPEANEGGRITGFPVHRGLFQSYMPAALAKEAENWRELKAIEGDNESVAARQMAIYEQYLDMPMEQSLKLIGDISVLIREAMLSFYNGTLTAEQAASELQNKISLYLME